VVVREQLDAAESASESAHTQMLDKLRERYQEEQIWSNWVRSLSTYGTAGLMAVNVVLFMLVHGWLEPRRRRIMMLEMRQMLSDEIQQDRQLGLEAVATNALAYDQHRDTIAAQIRSENERDVADMDARFAGLYMELGRLANVIQSQREPVIQAAAVESISAVPQMEQSSSLTIPPTEARDSTQSTTAVATAAAAGTLLGGILGLLMSLSSG
jgi:hypothetical protein